MEREKKRHKPTEPAVLTSAMWEVSGQAWMAQREGQKGSIDLLGPNTEGNPSLSLSPLYTLGHNGCPPVPAKA
jgi:hypothetical protein